MTKQKKFITCDGNQAAAHISYMFSEVAAWLPSQVMNFFCLVITKLNI